MSTAHHDLVADSWSDGYNALGERLWRRDAKNQTTPFGYDGLGRLTTRSDAEGTHTFTFGASAAAKNIGRLASMAGPGYAESYAYDAIGRLQSRTINAIDENGAAEHDPHQRVSSATTPPPSTPNK